MDTQKADLNPTPAETDSAQTNESVEISKSENRVDLETPCPMGAKPSVEMQHLRTFDDDGPERPIETQRLFVAEIPAGAETEEGEAPAISLCLTMTWSTVFA